MAVVDLAYCTLEELRIYIGSTATNEALVEAARVGAARAIDKYCHRRFYRDQQVADDEVVDAEPSARLFRVAPFMGCSPEVVYVPDFVPDVDGFLVETDDDGDGTFETTWAEGTDYELEPLNPAADYDGPQNSIRAVGDRCFPVAGRGRRRAGLRVTALWGFPSIPDDVHQANLIVALDLVKAKDAPFGTAGVADLGLIRIRTNPLAQVLLDPFVLVDDGIA